jgi:hypothetical protein
MSIDLYPAFFTPQNPSKSHYGRRFRPNYLHGLAFSLGTASFALVEGRVWIAGLSFSQRRADFGGR